MNKTIPVEILYTVCTQKKCCGLFYVNPANNKNGVIIFNSSIILSFLDFSTDAVKRKKKGKKNRQEKKKK